MVIGRVELKQIKRRSHAARNFEADLFCAGRVDSGLHVEYLYFPDTPRRADVW
jgi:hypothetical protein